MRGAHADFAVLDEGRVQFLVVVKSVGVLPNAAHLLRLSGTSAPAYAIWGLVTNAEIWACYRLGVGPDRHPELVFRVGLNDAVSLEEKTAQFFLLCKEAFAQNALTQYWEQARVMHPSRIAALLLSEETLHLLRREIQRTSNYRVDTETLREMMIRTVLRPETLISPNASVVPDRNQPQCYAYVRDPNDPATWRLRYRNPDSSPNAELLTQAVTELGQDERSLGIPGDDVPIVRQRLRQAFLELGVSPNDLPPLLRE
jgi:DNA-binding protein H-NS